MIALLILIGVGLIYNIYRDRSSAKERFELQMTMADAQGKMTNPLTFDACRGVVNNIINFYCVTEDVNRGYWTKTPEELSLELDAVVVEIAILSRMALSQEVIRQFGKFATIDGDDSYLEYYILNTTKILLMDEINNRRKIGRATEPNVPRVSVRDIEKKQPTNRKR